MFNGNNCYMCNEGDTTLPVFDSIEELVEFFDTNDVGDLLASMQEVKFDVVVKNRRERD